MKKLTPEDTSQEIKTQEEEENLPSSSPYFLFYEEWIQVLNEKESILFGVICNRSRKNFYAHISDQTLTEIMRWSQSALTRWMNSLEAKGLIYRYSVSCLKGGKVRRIIPISMAQNYWRKILQPLPDAETKFSDFIEFMNNGVDPKTLKKKELEEIPRMPNNDHSRMPKNGHWGRLTENGHSKTKGYIIKDYNNILLQTSSLPESDVESSEEEELTRMERELRERGFGAEQIELGKKFFSAFHEEVKSKRSTIAFLVKSLTSGIAADRLQALEQSRDLEDAHAPLLPNQEQNRALATQAVERLGELPRGYRVSLGEKCVHFSWPEGSGVVSLGEPKFARLLEAHVSQIENLSRSPSEACAVGEGPTIGEPILRFATKTETATANGSANGPRKPSKGVRSAQNASRVSYAYAEELEPYAAFKSVWASPPPEA